MCTSSSETLWDRWLACAESEPEAEAIVHWVAGDPPRRWTRASLIERASAYAEQLQDHGIKRGDTCALVLRHDPHFYPLYMGVVALGAVPSVLAFPNARLHPTKFREGLHGMAMRSGLDWLLTERELEPVVAGLAVGRHSSIRGVVLPFEGAARLNRSSPARVPRSDRARPDEPALLQHSSGTTGLQKAVALSHRAILEHARRYADAISLSSADRVVSWLPLYHDMGLIAAFHIPLLRGVPLVQLDPFEWVAAPVLFLEAVSSERGTIAWLPNFAYNLMTDRIRDADLAGIRLDSVRMLVNCSEPVRAGSHARFAARFADRGLRPASLGAAYAMAETTFCVTQTEPGLCATQLPISRAALKLGHVSDPTSSADTLLCVSSGKPIDGCEVRVIDRDGQLLSDREPGELLVRSVSLFSGYRHNPAATAGVLRDGWYQTGDYGFVADGECFVIGRKKDIIIVAGRNIYPEDIEDAVSTVPGVTPGRVVAVGVPDERFGTEQVWIIAESPESDDGAAAALRLAIVRAAMAIDVTVSRVEIVPPRWLIKSSAGKPSRQANRDRLVQALGVSEGGLTL